MVLPLLVGMAVVAGVSAATQTRAGDFSAKIDGRSLTAEQIYSRIRGGVGNGDLIRAREVAGELGERYSERSGRIRGLVAELDAAWQGGAAQAAVSHAAPLEHVFRESAALLRQVDDALAGQVDSFSRIYHSVDPVPAEPPQSGFVNDINPLTTDTDRAIDDYNEKASANVARYQLYNQDSVANGSRMPVEYPSLPLDVPPISISGSSPHGSVGTTSAGEGTTTGSAVSPVETTAPHRGSSSTGHASPLPALHGDSRDAGQAGALPTGATTASGVSPTPSSGAGGPSRTTLAAADRAVTGSATSGVGALPAGWTGSTTARGAGPTGSGGGRQAVRGQVGRGQVGRATPATTGDVPTTGRPGGTPVAGVAGGVPHGTPRAARQDDDDIEHRSVLIQPDPDELFGLEDLTPPAVIGEDEDA